MVDIKKRQSLFKNPDGSYRGKPFWSWNGDLKEEELLRQIDIMKEMGFGGYFMHSRTGLETEYLGEKWFDVTNKCADYGDGLQMESWLYDEDRWPSGTAGGIVTKEERFRSMFIEMKLEDASGFLKYQWSENTAAVFACRMDGEFYSSERRLREGDALREDETAVIFETRYSECKDVYNGYTYLDTMNPAGVEEYINVTHRAYEKQCRGRIGTSIKGIFTDEPHRGAMFSDFSEGREYAVPYTRRLFEEFKSRFGYPLEDNLLDLFMRKEGSPLSKAAADYIELCQELFLESFAIPIQNWCHDNGMIFTGHVLHEDCLCAQTIMQGSLMRFYEYMDYPGIDLLSESNECWWIAKQVESVARQLGKEKILSEMYGGTGWQMGFEGHKNVGDWQALLGVNLRCPHLSWYTMKGEAKRDFPASILHQSSWYKEYEYLETYFSRIHAIMEEGEADCELLVINPIESVWARAKSFAFSGLSARDEGIKAIEERYQETFRMLMRNKVEFDYGEEDIIGRHGTVSEGWLHVGKCSYKRVLVTGMDTIRGRTLELLETFKAQGGTVIFAGKAPEFVNVQKSSRAEQLAEKSIHVPFIKEELIPHCRSGREAEITGPGAENIFARVKTSENSRIIMFLNMDRVNNYPDLKIRLGKGERAERWDPRSGEILQAEAVSEQGELVIEADFFRGEEKIYVVYTQDAAAEGLDVTEIKKEEPAYKKKGQLYIPDELDYELYEENICVLDSVKVSMDEGTESPVQEVLRADQWVRDVLGMPYRGGEMLQPWYQRKHGIEKGREKCIITLEYAFDIEKVPDKISLVLENLECTEGISINGEQISLVSDGKWIDICFDRLQLNPLLLKVGKNILRIRMDYDGVTGIEAVYLLGDFGVYLRQQGNMAIAEMPRKLKAGDITGQGFPFYTGKMAYKIEGMKGKRVVLEELDYEGAYLKIAGRSEEITGWLPYGGYAEDLERIEIGLTRRNTFGPLHRLPLITHDCSPGSFLTEGDEWQDAPVLFPQGLMKLPAIFEVE